MKTAVITFVYNEAVNLPIWIRYFGAQVGTKNLFVVDLGTDDGSTDGLGEVNRIAVPRVQFDEYAKTSFINALQKGLLNYYDTVIYTDADELVVPDPDRYADLRAYLEGNKSDYVSCVGLNIVHMLTIEEPLDLARPVLQQRRFAKFWSATCKPAVSRVPMNWSPGFHGADKPPRIDPALFLFHTKWMDYGLAMRRHRTSREATYSRRTVEDGLGAHSRYDNDRFVREGFLKQIGRMAQGDMGSFDFTEEIAAIEAGSVAGAGVHHIPMDLAKIVEIPDRFRTVF